MKKILIYCESELHRDPRVLKQIKALQDKYEIYTAGFTKSELNVKNHFYQKINNSKPKHWSYSVLLRKAVSFKNKIYEKSSFLYKKSYFEKKYWTKERKELLTELEKHNFDLIIANDITALPLSVRYSKKRDTKIIFDAHEYYPRQFENNSQWVKAQQAYYTYLCVNYIDKSDLMLVVNDGIGKLYEKLGIKTRYITITNAVSYEKLKPTDITDKIKLVHHGMANKERNIEEMLNLFEYLDSCFELHLYLVTNKNNENYYKYLKKKVQNNKNIYFQNPVPFNEISKTINKYDSGIFLINTKTYYSEYALPNKFFEFIQARLGIIIGPSKEMSNYVEKYDLGIISKDFTAKSMAEELNKLTPEKIQHYKNQAHKHAKELSFEKNKAIIQKEVEKLIGK